MAASPGAPPWATAPPRPPRPLPPTPKRTNQPKSFPVTGDPHSSPRCPTTKCEYGNPRTEKKEGERGLCGGGGSCLAPLILSSSTSKSLSLFLQPRGGRCLISADLSASDWHSFGGRGGLGVGRIFKIKMWSPQTFGRVFIGS